MAGVFVFLGGESLRGCSQVSVFVIPSGTSARERCETRHFQIGRYSERMIKVTVLYPKTPDTRFDVEYYLGKHMPRSIELLSPALKGVSVEIGTGGVLPGEPPPFAAICAFTFESLDAFVAAFMPHAAELQGDIPNYTNATAIIQVSELRIAQ